MSTAWLIRHGQSTANAGQATDDPEMIPLTDLGHEQARRTSLAFVRPPGLIVTSKYLRAQQTAEYTTRRFPTVPLETWNIHEFTYLSATALANTTAEDRRPLVQSYWSNADPYFVHGEGAESFAGFIGRVEVLHQQLLARKEDFTAVFCHGFVMKAIFWAHLLGTFEPTVGYMRGFAMFHRSFDLFNCAIMEMQIESGKVMLGGLQGRHLA